MAAPLDVAMTATTLVPTAYRISNPNTNVNIGVMKVPPPIPKIEPSIPLRTDKEKETNE
jgi:hypothetical protein